MNDSKRVPLTPARKKRRRRKKILRISAILFFSIFFISAFVLSFRIPQIQIKAIIVEGNTGINTEDIQSIAEKTLNGNYLYIFPRRNILLYSKKSIVDAIHQEFNQVGDISVTATSLSAIAIALHERKPHSLWCADLETSTCYFMDSTGFIFALAPTMTGTAYLKYFGGIEGSPINKEFLTPVELSLIETFTQKVKDLGLMPYALVLINKNEYKMLLTNGGEILFSSNDMLNQEFANLSLLLKEAPLKTGFTYIDLRYGNKLIYKTESTGQASTTIDHE